MNSARALASRGAPAHSLVMTLTLFGCGPKPPSAAPEKVAATSEIAMRISPELARSPGEIDRKFSGGAYDVTLQSGEQHADNCRALLPMLSDPKLEVAGSQNDFSAFWAQAVQCAALAYLDRARPARVSLIRPLLARDPRTWLPPELSLLADQRERAAVRAAGERCTPWAEHEPDLQTRSADDQRASFQNGVWSAEVTYYALADFDADGFEDLLLRRDASVDEGSYGDSILLLVSRTRDSDCARVVERVP